jgi:hypothetical protein
MHIEIRRWFQRTYGNTYFSARVYREGAVCEVLIPFQYGYGSHGLWETVKTLGFSGPLEYREAGHTYSEVDVTRKGDM